MNNENLLQNIILSVVISLVVSFVVVSAIKPEINIPLDLGGYTAGHWDSADGYKVDGTTVIDGSGNYDGAITGTSATLSSTLAVTGETNVDTLIFGGGVFSTSSSVAATLSAAEVCDYSVIRADPTASFTLTFPATSTLYADCLSAVGDTKIMLIENATTGTANVTIAAGTGGTLLEEGTGGDVVLAQDEWAILIITRIDNSEYTLTVLTLRDG